MSSPLGGTLLGQAYQLGYVTNDLDRALDILKDQYGVDNFLVLKQSPPIPIETGGEMMIEGAFAWVGPTMIEIVLPIAGQVEIYTDWLPKDRFALRLHHIGVPIRSDAEWNAMRRDVDQSGKKIMLSLNHLNTRALYIDAADTLGHYIEYLYLTGDVSSSWLTRIPQNIPGYEIRF